MNFKRITRNSVALAIATVVAVAGIAVAGPPPGKGKKPKPPPPPPPTEEPEPDPDPAPTYNAVDVEFVNMMIPHHFQATVMGQLAASRAGSEDVRALAERIEIEQVVEIGMMQNWQNWNALSVTNAPMAYEMMLGNPMMLEMMGMASPAQMAALEASSGAAFDQLYLELMITHHQGALRMLVNVLTNGTNTTMEFWATDMLTAQTQQIEVMQAMLADSAA